LSRRTGRGWRWEVKATLHDFHPLLPKFQLGFPKNLSQFCVPVGKLGTALLAALFPSRRGANLLAQQIRNAEANARSHTAAIYELQ
jgi:hypothetical protein